MFHSLHHTQFRTNYSLFMPIYDYIYNTMDKSSDALYESMLNGKSDMPHVVHLSHPTSIHSIYHLRLGFAYVASKPYVSEGYLWMLWPFTWSSMLVTWLFGSTFTVEKIKLNKLKMQTWAIPRYSFQYMLSWQRNSINYLIEKAILEAEQVGVKVMSLGLLNQGEELNRNGEIYLLKHPKLKVRIVDGSSLAAAVVLKSIPQGTKQVLLQGSLSKVGYAITIALCQRGVQVILVRENQYQKLKLCLPEKLGIRLVYSNSYNPKVWLVADGLREEEQRKAPKGTKFIPFSPFPVKKIRKDCTYFNTPAMVIPKDLENMHACENWLPRRVMSAWRVAGIVHALEGWDAHECGDRILDVEKIWDAALQHGFNPLVYAAGENK